MAARIYAQLNDENICFCVSQLAGEVANDRLIPLGRLDEDVLGKRYEDDGWHELREPELEFELESKTIPEALAEQQSEAE